MGDMGGMGGVNTHQTDWWFRNDDGTVDDDESQGGATWLTAARNTIINMARNAPQFRLRILCFYEEKTASGLVNHILFVSKNSGVYHVVNTQWLGATDVECVIAGNINTMNHQRNTVDSYSAGEVLWDTVENFNNQNNKACVAGEEPGFPIAGARSGAVAWNGNNPTIKEQTPFEFSIQLIPSDLAVNDTLEFRVYQYPANALTSYQAPLPKITVTADNPAYDQWIPAMNRRHSLARIQAR